MTFFDVIVYLIIMVITVVQLMSAWFLDSKLLTCSLNLTVQIFVREQLGVAMHSEWIILNDT